jgi:hypothetical protein
MRFRAQRIQPGYCEIGANERDGQRYELLALVTYDDMDKSWHWSAARHGKPPFYMPQYTRAFRLRRDCISDCKRVALLLLVGRAIAEQTKESPHWHSPRRDAWCTVSASHLFTQEELHEIKIRLMTFEEKQS